MNSNELMRFTVTSLAQRVLMVRPNSFRCNEETVGTNAFQDISSRSESVLADAQREFDLFKGKLEAAGIEVVVQAEPEGVDTPDALFPNNWFAVLPDGRGFLFPMQATNRRREVQPQWIAPFVRQSSLIDLRAHEQDQKFLEGTGSMILDHVNREGYACLSERTQSSVIKDFEQRSGYKIHTFTAVDGAGRPFYHTNVMMALGEKTAILCAESIRAPEERQLVLSHLERSGRRVVEITMTQVLSFAGNMLQLSNKKSEKFWICSERAYQSLTIAQKDLLSSDAAFIRASIPTIERVGGGSARCMLGELF